LPAARLTRQERQRQNMSHPELTIKGILLPLRLGCSAEDRLNPQPVEIDVAIRFETPPRGMITDRLEDTVCYDALVGAIKELTSDHEFSLIEYLANDILTSLRRIVESEHELRVPVRKVSPPVPEITKGAEFTVGD
jgi:dihydroneopterin aldolase